MPSTSKRSAPESRPSVAAALRAACATLAASDSARLDAEVLLGAVTGRPRHHAFAWPERLLSAAEHARYLDLVDRRASGEPVAYLIGRRAFWSLELEVGPATLVPRPETECLVERALALAGPLEQARVLDLGTGSGAIALALAAERPGWRLVASDRSAAALEVAERNARRLATDSVAFRQGDWLDAAADERFDLVISNPPYVAAGDPHLTRGDVRFEPVTALVAGSDGLDAIRVIIARSRAHLELGGWLVLEHGYDQGARVRSLLEAAGYGEVSTTRDLAGHERVSCGRAG